MNKAVYYLPDFYEKQKLNMFFISLKEMAPELFSNDIQIGAVYGSFPHMKWNGGRHVRGEKVGLESAEQIFSAYNEVGIPIRLTMTNPLIKSPHLSDEYCNQIMTILSDCGNAHGMNNEVLVASDILEQYIRGKWPSLNIISSTTKCITEIEELNKELQRDYSLVVMDFRKNRDEMFLSQISHPEKIEIMVNEYCSPECPYRKEHYALIAKDSMEDTVTVYRNGQCKVAPSLYRQIKQNSTTILPEEIPLYMEKGFTHFKIVGRANAVVDTLETYLYYFIKPEYKDSLRLDLLMVFFPQTMI